MDTAQIEDMTSDQDTYKIRYELTDDLVRRAMAESLHMRYGRLIIPLYLLLGAGALSLAVFEITRDLSLLPVFWLFLAVLFFSYPIRTWWLRRKNLRYFQRCTDKSVDMELLHEGIRMRSPFGEGLSRWHAFTHLDCGPSVWLLYITAARNAFYMVPVSSMSPDAQKFLLERIAEQGIKICGRKKNPAREKESL